MEADFEQLWVNFRPILNNFGSIFGQFMQKMGQLFFRQKRRPILNNFGSICGQFWMNGPKKSQFLANLCKKWPSLILNSFGSIFGQFTFKKWPSFGKKHGGQFWTTLGQFWPIYAKKKMAIFSRQKKEANFWTILGQFLANLFRKKKWPLSRQKTMEASKIWLVFWPSLWEKIAFSSEFWFQNQT